MERRIEQSVEENLGDDQFGFRRNRGTREAILSLRLIIEREESVYIGFIDLEQAFDNANWEMMFKILKQTGIKFRGRRLIYNLYQNQIAIINIGDEEREAKIKKRRKTRMCSAPHDFQLTYT